MEAKKRMCNRCTFEASSNWNKRAQVTIFIIVGIVLVFAFAAILYFTRTTTTQEIATAEEPISVTVPQEFVPIQRYTENCLFEIGKRGIKVLGQHGGYIYPDMAGKYSADDPTNADGFLVGTQEVPYWHYNIQSDRSRSVTFASLRPKLYEKDDPVLSVESQLSRYVKEQLDDCLDNYTGLREQYQIDLLDGGNKEVKARVGETGITFSLTLAIKATQGSSTQEIDSFGVKVPIHFKHYYEVASTIMEAQQNNSFLERQGLELLSIYSRKDSRYFAPISDVSFDSFSDLSWTESQLKVTYQDLLTSHIPFLRFLGSRNFYRATYPEGEILAQQALDNMVLTLQGAEDLEVSFDYLGWKPYLKSNSINGKIIPEKVHVTYWALDYSHQRYETHYDISYPALVTVSDSTAFDGEGYSLVFGLESNVRNNAPAKAGDTWEGYPKPQINIMCDEEFRTTGDIKTVVIDSYTKKPLEDVLVGFSIPEQTSCDIGVTDTDGELVEKYPGVYGGMMSFAKPEYSKSYYSFNTYKYQNKSASVGYAVEGVKQPKVVELDKLKAINVTIKKKELKECVTPMVCRYTTGTSVAMLPFNDVACKKGSEKLEGWDALIENGAMQVNQGPFCYFNQGDSLFDKGTPVYSFQANASLSRYHDFYFVDKEVPMTVNEKAYINLERVETLHPGLKSEAFSVAVTGEGGEPTQVQLLPGVYKLSGSVTIKKTIVIPKENRCTNYDMVSGITLYATQWDTSNCQDLNETVLEEYVIGGVNFENESTYITITPEQLYGSSNITFYLLSQAILPLEGALSAPQKIPSKKLVCTGSMCVPKVGCPILICGSKDIDVSGMITESLTVSGKLSEISAMPEVYPALQPEFS